MHLSRKIGKVLPHGGMGRRAARLGSHRIDRVVATVALGGSCLVGLAASASGMSTGNVGASGKAGGFFCRNCHTGGTAPTVAFEGPAAVDPGAIATFRFIVRANSPSQTIAGLNVAASDGTLGLVDGQGTRLELGEITHSTPKANDGSGQAAFDVTWQAPSSPGVYTLFGAGTSANDDQLRLGDAAARVEFEVFVGIPTPTPPATATAGVPTPTATATATPEVSDCAGDCNGDGEITVDELITGVNVALGAADISSCLAFDTNRDGTVTVDEILVAVNRALTGCPTF